MGYMTGAISRYIQGQTPMTLGSVCDGGVGQPWAGSHLQGGFWAGCFRKWWFQSQLDVAYALASLNPFPQLLWNQCRHHCNDHHCCGVHFRHHLLLPDQGEAIPPPFLVQTWPLRLGT